MAAIKKFFQKRKLQAQFQLAGQGRQLGSPSSSNQPQTSKHQQQQKTTPKPALMTEEAKRAGAAALARFDQHQQSAPSMASRSQQVIRAEALKELERERSSETIVSAKPTGPKETFQESAPVLAVSGVYFKCPLVTSEILTKPEMNKRIEEFLYDQLKEDAEVTPCYMIRTINRKDKVEVCVKTLSKYLENIIENPDEEKYQKIRVNNKVFQEKVASLKGVKEFLLAAGFELKQLPPGEDAPPEDFYIFNKENLDKASTLLDILQTTEPILPELDRNVKVFAPSENSSGRIQLPSEFFNITADDVKAEHKLKTEEVEKNQMLRTKAMREKDEIRELRRYKFTLIRVKFPDGIILQATFSVHDTLDTVQDFVLNSLVNDWQPFHLTTATGQRLTESEKSLLQLHLVPAALIHFAWDPEIANELRRETGVESNSYLNDEMLQYLEELRVSTS